jgi:hypothetical protein
MYLRIGRDRDLEVGDPAEAGHQIRGIGIPGMVRLVLAAARHIAAQGHDMAHTRLPVRPCDVVDRAGFGPDAGEVGGRRQAGLGDDA